MKFVTPLLALVLFPLPAHTDPGQASNSSITITRTENGCDVTLLPDALNTVTDQLWVVVDGKSEGFVGGSYKPDLYTLPLHYTGSVSSELDGQVKDILKAQGLPVKANITTYRVSGGINIRSGGVRRDFGTGGNYGGFRDNSEFYPSGAIYTFAGTVRSETLRFRHMAYAVVSVELPSSGTYKIGDKIPVFEALALDSSVTMRDALGPNNDISSGKFVHLPNDLLHRITIQVQFVTKPTP